MCKKPQLQTRVVQNAHTKRYACQYFLDATMYGTHGWRFLMMSTTGPMSTADGESAEMFINLGAAESWLKSKPVQAWLNRQWNRACESEFDNWKEIAR